MFLIVAKSWVKLYYNYCLKPLSGNKVLKLSSKKHKLHKLFIIYRYNYCGNFSLIINENKN